MSSRRSRRGAIRMLGASNRLKRALEKVPARTLARRSGEWRETMSRNGGRSAAGASLECGLIPRAQVFRAAQIETPRPGTGCVGRELPARRRAAVWRGWGPVPLPGLAAWSARNGSDDCRPQSVNELGGQAPAAARLPDDQHRAIGRGESGRGRSRCGSRRASSEHPTQSSRRVAARSWCRRMRFSRRSPRYPISASSEVSSASRWTGTGTIRGRPDPSPGKVRPGVYRPREAGSSPLRGHTLCRCSIVASTGSGAAVRVHDHRRGVPGGVCSAASSRTVDSRSTRHDASVRNRAAWRAGSPSPTTTATRSPSADGVFGTRAGRGEGHGDAGGPEPPPSLLPRPPGGPKPGKASQPEERSQPEMVPPVFAAVVWRVSAASSRKYAWMRVSSVSSG